MSSPEASSDPTERWNLIFTRYSKKLQEIEALEGHLQRSTSSTDADEDVLSQLQNEKDEILQTVGRFIAGGLELEVETNKALRDTLLEGYKDSNTPEQNYENTIKIVTKWFKDTYGIDEENEDFFGWAVQADFTASSGNSKFESLLSVHAHKRVLEQ